MDFLMSTDYTSCSSNNCPIKEKCKRFTGPKEPLNQSYFTEIPGKWENEIGSFSDGFNCIRRVWKCQMFWGEAQDSIMNQLNEIMK